MFINKKFLIVLLVLLVTILGVYWFYVRPLNKKSYCEKYAINSLGVVGKNTMNGEYSSNLDIDGVNEIVQRVIKTKNSIYESCLRQNKVAY